MAVQGVKVEELLQMMEAVGLPLLDVRSPGEFAHAHIPGAFSLPLFDDEQRREIGTAYKQVSREVAIKIGLDAFGPKMRKLVEEVEGMVWKKGNKENQSILIHCWRGGMRSSAMAWLMDLYGFKVFLLEGGYKAYRQWVIRHWQLGRSYRILDGMTGAGKTEVLKELERKGELVLDLEGLAGHKGSAFGGLDKVPQPSQEMFENLIADRMERLERGAKEKAIWIENESQRVGDLNIPAELFRNWHNGSVPMVFLDLPFEERLDRITREYGRHSTESLINAIVRIKKRLGPLETKTAIARLVEGDVRACFHILLKYYDRHYGETKAKDRFDTSGMSSQAIAELLLNKYS